MKRTPKFLAIALLTVLMLWGCGTSGPKEVGMGFITALYDGDIDGAKEYGDDFCRKYLTDNASNFATLKNDMAKIEFGEVKEDGDRATLTYTVDGKDEAINLVRKDGVWKAIIGGGDVK